MLLSAHRDELRANVLFVFQPAEEKLKGAKYMLEHNVFSQYKPSAVFGLHNLPELPVGHRRRQGRAAHVVQRWLPH